VKIFGHIIVNSGEGRQVPLRYTGEQHVREELGRNRPFRTGSHSYRSSRGLWPEAARRELPLIVRGKTCLMKLATKRFSSRRSLSGGENSNWSGLELRKESG
jgi:hypothetical protein